MHRLALILILIVGCTAPAPESIDFVPAISVAVGVAEATPGGAVPSPEPAPGVCDNCNGTGKVGDGTVFVPCAACGGDGKIESLVAKLVPGGGALDAPSKAAPPALRDGQLSPRGQWRWSEAAWAWQPVKPVVVKQSGPMWLQDGHGATISHLVNEHGYSRASLAGLSQSQLDILHSNAHNAARAAAPVRSSGCPGGVCPSPSRSRGLFRRR